MLRTGQRESKPFEQSMNASTNDMLNYAIQFWSWLTGLPEQMQGIIIGSVFTLSGVWLTNRGSLKNLRQQLSHDRTQKKIEHELGLRRDVYLGAAQSISDGITAISRLADLSISYAEAVNKFNENSSQIAKIHVVAKEETAIAFLDFGREFSKAMTRVNIARRPVQAIKDQMGVHLESMRRHQGNRDQALELMKQMTLNAIRDDGKFKRLSDAFEYEQEQATKALLNHDELLEKLKPAHMQLFKTVLDEQRGLFKTLIPVLKNIREELDMPIDAIKYGDALARSDGFDEATLNEIFGLTEKNG
jgi:hypothetical protein